MQLAPVIRQSLSLWHNPDFQALPAEDVVSAANRCFMRHSLDLELTADAVFYNAIGDVFTFASPDDRDITLTALGITDLSRIVRIESRPSTSTDEESWEKMDFVTWANWPSDNLAAPIAVYSGPDGETTLRIDRDGTNDEFRIIYRSLRERIEVTDQVVDVPAVYEPVFVYDLALEFGEMIDDRSPEFKAVKADKMRFLLTRLTDEMDRVDRWRRQQHPGGVIRRRAFNDRKPGFELGKRRFILNY